MRVMTDQANGLYQKYSVKRLNDSNGKHENCEFFVLDLTHDKFARDALATYIVACRKELPNLANDLEQLLK